MLPGVISSLVRQASEEPPARMVSYLMREARLSMGRESARHQLQNDTFLIQNSNFSEIKFRLD